MSTKPQLPLILITAFLDILGMSLFIPVLPTIILHFGVASSWTGYTQAFYAMGMFIGGLFFGRWSDVHGRKKMLSYTSLLNLLSFFLMLLSIWFLKIDMTSSMTVSPGEISHIRNIFTGFTPLFVLFLFARFVGGLGGSGFGVIQAYISDISSPEEKTKRMGMMGASFGMAFLIGPAIGGILSEYAGIPAVLVLCIVIVVINVLSIWLILEEPQKHHHSLDIHLADFHFSSNILSLLGLSFGATLAFAAIQSMSTQFYTDRFHFNASMIGYTMAMVGLISVLYQGWLVKYIRKYLDEIKMIHFAFFILCFAFIGFAINNSPNFLFFWLIFLPIGMGSFQPSIASLMSKSAGREVGKVMGYNTSIQSVGQIVGPILAGLLYYTPATGLPFFVSAGMFGILFLLSFRLHK